MRQKLFTVTIKDCDVQTFSSGGPGGQHQNKTASGVRVIHRPSGAVGESRETRSQLTNKRNAFRRMAESKQFRLWVRLISAEMSTGKTLEQRVDDEMTPDKLKTEVHTATGWVPFADVSEDDGGE